MACIYSTVTPQKFLSDLLRAGVISKTCELWENPEINEFLTVDGAVKIAPHRTWVRWLYNDNGNPPTLPRPDKQLLLGIKYQELLGE